MAIATVISVVAVAVVLYHIHICMYIYIKSILGGHIVITLYRKNSEKPDIFVELRYMCLGYSIHVLISMCMF